MPTLGLQSWISTVLGLSFSHRYITRLKKATKETRVTYTGDCKDEFTVIPLLTSVIYGRTIFPFVWVLPAVKASNPDYSLLGVGKVGSGLGCSFSFNIILLFMYR